MRWHFERLLMRHLNNGGVFADGERALPNRSKNKDLTLIFKISSIHTDSQLIVSVLGKLRPYLLTNFLHTKMRLFTISIKSCLLLIALLGISITAYAEPIRVFEGKAYDLKTGEFVYSEKNVYDDDPANATLTTTYYSPSDELIGERVVNFEQDRVSEYVFTQSQLDNEERIVRDVSAIRYLCTLDGKASSKSFNSKPVNDVMISVGLLNHIEREWSGLIAGEKMSYDFAIPLPAKRRTVNMVAQLAESATASEILPNENLITISNTISNKLFRWLMSPIEFGYYKDTKQLAFYKGPTNLKDKNNKKMKPVYVIFDRT